MRNVRYTKPVYKDREVPGIRNIRDLKEYQEGVVLHNRPETKILSPSATAAEGDPEAQL